MLDDIAYLRWIAIGKELRVEDLVEEAVNLTQFPSPRLNVTGQGAARMRTFANEHMRDSSEDDRDDQNHQDHQDHQANPNT